MADDVRVRARIHLLATEAGGRATPLAGGTSYRPNHNFFGPDSRAMSIGFIDLPERTIAPGDTFEAEIRFLMWEGIIDKVSPGRTWRIQEGAKLVGTGEVLDLLD